ncbi:MAG: hypothetical protein IIB87_04325 [Chloroflexi bacterium]|nr:hypothetical protein [Chloroflexota bacterium]
MESLPSAAPFIGESSPDSLRVVYTKRLRRLLRLRHDHEDELNGQGLRLLDKAIFAAYCACRDVGAETKAREVLRTANVTLKRTVGQLKLDNEQDQGAPSEDEYPSQSASAG